MKRNDDGTWGARRVTDAGRELGPRRRGPVAEDYVPETVEEFYEPPVGQWRFGAFPPDRLLIGMAFEAGGAYEDWGWVMYEKTFVEGSGLTEHGGCWRLRRFAEARTLPDLLAKAEARAREASGR